jgi:predicted GNAT family acetyltransferase
MMLNIKEATNLFYIGSDEKNIEGKIDYTIEDQILTIWHTVVGDSLKGQGAGSVLVAYAVDYARKNQLMINPVCTYALSQFEKKPDYADVWVKK